MWNMEYGMWIIDFNIMNKTNSKIVSFTDLEAWQEGHGLVLMIYRMTKRFPREESFGLVIEMRRCAVSITSNIAEGFGRASYKDKVKFYLISRSSLLELQNQLIIAHDIDYIDDDEYKKVDNQTVKVHKILNGLISKSKSYF